MLKAANPTPVMFVEPGGRTSWRYENFFPESEKEFFLRVVNAQITFVTDAQGKATKLILHQNGMEHTGKRID
jgi:hypothetical protein